MRDAYTLFDQVASFSSDHITLDKIRERLNLAGFTRITDIVRKAITQDIAGALESLSSLYQDGVAAEQIVKECAEFFRTLLLYKSGITRPDMLSTTESDIPKDVVEALSKEQIECALRAFLNLYRDMRYTISPRFETELIVSRLANLPSLTSPDVLVKKLEAMKQGIMEGRVVIQKKTAPVLIERKEEGVEEDKKNNTQSIETQPEIVEEETRDEGADEESSVESEEEVEEPAASSSLSLESIPELTMALRDMNKGHLAGNFASIEDIIDSGDGSVIFKMKSLLAFNSIKTIKDDLEKAITSITGEHLLVKFEYNAPKVVEEREPSDKMKSLRTMLGGKIILIEIPENNKQENTENEFQSIRTSQADGEPRISDEEAEGEDE